MQDIVKDIFLAIVATCLNPASMTFNELRIKQSDVNLLAKDLWGYFAVVGIGMTIIYFLIEINNKLAFERSDFSMRSFGAPFLKLAAAILVLSNGGKLIGYAVGLGNNFIKFAANTYDPAFEAAESVTESIETMTDGIGFFLAIALLLPCFVMMIVSVVCSLVWKYKALMFKLEVFFRLGISPVALADVYSGQNAQAIRWVKAMLGLMLYGASFVVVVKMGNALALKDFADKFIEMAEGGRLGVWELIGSFAGMLVVPIAELSAIGVIRSAIKEALA